MALQFESPLLRPAFEMLERSTRNAQKLATKELSAVAANAKSLLTNVKGAKQLPAVKESALKALNSMVSQLQGLKRKLEENQKSSDRCVQKFTARIEHLDALDEAHAAMAAVQRDLSIKRSKRSSSALAVSNGGGGGGGSGSSDAAAASAGAGDLSLALTDDDKALNDRWLAAEELVNTSNKKRLDRIFADHLFRAGLYTTAQSLVTEAKLTDLVDVDLFLSARRVFESLNQFDVTRGLAWCGENRSKLGRLKSPLEFNLRMQEFIELLRASKVTEAVAYSQKHFTAHAEEHLTEIQRAMSLIAFLPSLQPLPSLTPADEKNGSAQTAGAIAIGTGSGKSAMEIDTKQTATAAATGTVAVSSGSAAAASATTLPVQSLPPQQRLLSRSSSTASAGGDEPSTPTALLRRTSSTGSAAGDEKDSKAADSASAEPKTDPLKSLRALFDRSRWSELATQFRIAHYQLLGLTTNSLFDITMQAGLCALKTPYCGGGGGGNSAATASGAAVTDHHLHSACPVCCTNPPITALASKLPVSQRMHSRIVCRLSGQIMDEHNPPLVLPNGSVYSKHALQLMAAQNGGLVTCQRTRNQYPIELCRPAYVL